MKFGNSFEMYLSSCWRSPPSPQWSAHQSVLDEGGWCSSLISAGRHHPEPEGVDYGRPRMTGRCRRYLKEQGEMVKCPKESKLVSSIWTSTCRVTNDLLSITIIQKNNFHSDLSLLDKNLFSWQNIWYDLKCVSQQPRLYTHIHSRILNSLNIHCWSLDASILLAFIAHMLFGKTKHSCHS